MTYFYGNPRRKAYKLRCHVCYAHKKSLMCPSCGNYICKDCMRGGCRFCRRWDASVRRHRERREHRDNPGSGRRRYRRNSDERIRELERRWQSGLDREALRALVHELLRADKLTIGKLLELGNFAFLYLPPEVARRLLDGLFLYPVDTLDPRIAIWIVRQSYEGESGTETVTHGIYGHPDRAWRDAATLALEQLEEWNNVSSTMLDEGVLARAVSAMESGDFRSVVNLMNGAGMSDQIRVEESWLE